MLRHIFLRLPPPPSSSLFPYTTLFRSKRHRLGVHVTELLEALESIEPIGGVTTEQQPAGTHPEYGDLVRLTGLTRSPYSDRKSTRLNSSHTVISYAVFCLKKKKKRKTT